MSVTDTSVTVASVTEVSVEQADGSGPGNARSADLEDGCPRADARLGHRAADPPDVRRGAAGRAERALPGAAQARATGLDRRRVEAVRQQPAREVLQADRRRPQSPGHRGPAVGASVGGHFAHRQQGLTEEAPMARWLTAARLRFRSLFFRTRVERELEEELAYHFEREI